MLRPQAKAIDLGGKPDLKDPDLYMRDEHHAVFRKLRAEEPVYWNPEADAAGFWAVTRYDDIEAISKNPGLFSSAKNNGGHRIFNENEIDGNDTDASMISMDPPEHAAYRRMVTPGFVPKRITGMEDRIRARVTRLLWPNFSACRKATAPSFSNGRTQPSARTIRNFASPTSICANACWKWRAMRPGCGSSGSKSRART